jgi:formylglycine-generating enzyme
MTYQEGDLLQQPDGSVFKLFGLDYTTFVYVEKGSFSMGDNNSGKADEREVMIHFKEGYFMGQYAVTQELYERVVGVNPARFKHKYRPVESVSWNDICQKGGFLDKLNQQIEEQYPFLKGTFALPSEAQWEYAAAGGKAWNEPKMAYSGSQDIEDVAWYNDNVDYQTMPVGLKQPNALGMFDMSGNVWEWCADIYIDNYNKIPNDGSACLKGSLRRILRGGSFFISQSHCKVRNRINLDPLNRIYYSGFRLVISLRR